MRLLLFLTFLLILAGCDLFSANVSTDFSANESIDLVKPLAEQTLYAGDKATVQLYAHFIRSPNVDYRFEADVEGEALMAQVQGNRLQLHAVAPGTAVVTVTARADGFETRREHFSAVVLDTCLPAPPAGATYFPLDEGNVWSYTFSGTRSGMFFPPMYTRGSMQLEVTHVKTCQRGKTLITVEQHIERFDSTMVAKDTYGVDRVTQRQWLTVAVNDSFYTEVPAKLFPHVWTPHKAASVLVPYIAPASADTLVAGHAKGCTTGGTGCAATSLWFWLVESTGPVKVRAGASLHPMSGDELYYRLEAAELQ